MRKSFDKRLNKILNEMDFTAGAGALSKSWQKDFPETTQCCRCGGDARHAFTAHEGLDGKEEKYVCDMHENEGKGGYWPHDAMAVSVYLCKDCLEPTALYNQA